MKDKYEGFDEHDDLISFEEYDGIWMFIPSKETQALIEFLELGLKEAKQGKFLTVEQFRDRMNLKYKNKK